jgi:hypothetical protein
MKKNLLLSSIVILLLVFAYFHEEVYKSGLKVKRLQGKTLVSSEVQFNYLKVNDLELINTDEGWVHSTLSHPVSLLKLDRVMENLGNIRLEKKIERKSQYFEKEFKFLFKMDELIISEFVIGSTSATTGSFYIEVIKEGKSQTYLAYSVTESKQVYRSDLDRLLNIYFELLNIINPKIENYLETGVSSFVDTTDLQSVAIDNTYNRPYILHFDKKETNPAPFKGILYQKDFTSIALKDFINGQFEKIETYDSRPVVNNLISEVKLVYKGNQEERSLFLYNDHDGKKGRFLLDKKNKKIYAMKADTIGFFFRPVQYYWDKRVHFERQLFKSNDIPFKFGKVDKTYEFVIPNIQEFSIRYLGGGDFKLKQDYFNLVFNILFGVEPFRQADYVTTPAFKKKMISSNSYLLDIFGQSFVFDFQGGDIIVTNRTKNYNLHFHHPYPETTPQSMNDFLVIR